MNELTEGSFKIPTGVIVFSVSDFLSVTDNALKSMGNAYVEGEISELNPNYRNLYFKIKDESSSCDCLLFANVLSSLSFQPQIGMKVTIVGSSSVYPKNGQFKLIVKNMYQSGRGLIMERLRQLKERLEHEGIFALHKRPLPRFIDTVGVITSLDGRVVHDIARTMARRCRGVAIIEYNAKVQGQDAPTSLIAALAQANAEKKCDVLIIGRGGGSFEDLLPFSDEALTRAVALSEIPVISAVGHEPDVALTDFAADVRAATPTAAAELVTSVTEADLNYQLAVMAKRCDEAMDLLLDTLTMRFETLVTRFKAAGPEHTIELRRSHILELCERMYDAVNGRLIAISDRQTVLKQKLYDNSPQNRLHVTELELLNLVKKFNDVTDGIVSHRSEYLSNLVMRLLKCDVSERILKLRTRFESLNASLIALNPLHILSRGYSITFDNKGQVITPDSVSKGQCITTLVKDGKIISTVTEVIHEKNTGT